MAKYYKVSRNSPILYHLSKMNLRKSDLIKHLNSTEPTVNSWIQRPLLIPLEKLVCMAGLFGIPVEELVYCLLRYKPTLSRKDKFGKWYIEDIRERNKE